MNISRKVHLPDKKTSIFSFDKNSEFDIKTSEGTTKISALTRVKNLFLPKESSHYIIVCSGEYHVAFHGQIQRLGADCFGCFYGEVFLEGNGRVLIISCDTYQCTTLMGGPIEKLGRLRYVDGCTTTILLPPTIRGEPCLNFMHLPHSISQTMHSHPSFRVGIILSGSGKCETENALLDFSAGTVFFIPLDAPHSFQSLNEELRIVIYHPDSDTGPTHSDNTMLNRTFVNGLSAQALKNLDGQEE